MNIEPEFTHKNLEFSKVLKDEYTWEELKATAFSFGDGWRVPTRGELADLFDAVKESRDNASVWSASAYAHLTLWAWCVSFNDGDLYYDFQYRPLNVRLVREAGPAESRIAIKPEFRTEELEFSEILQEEYTWEALQEVDFQFGNGWRVPTEDELKVLFDECKDSHGSIVLWSSEASETKGFAWNVDFYAGLAYSNYCVNSYNVRLVRTLAN